MKTKFDQSKLSAEQIHLGSQARAAFEAGENPPSWVEDEDAWADAKEAALKSYDLDDDAYWPVVTHIYENMGGGIADSDGALSNDRLELAIANDGSIDADGWALIAPFGEWPKTRIYREDGQMKEQKFLQVVDNEAADALVSREHSLFGRLKRAIIGIPIYKGHGDLKDIDPKALANTEHKIKLGVVDQVRKASRGLEAHFALDNDGAQAVAAGYKFPSSFWWVKASGQRGDAILARPVKLISVALTQFPNISGVESLANSRDAARTQNPKPKTRMKELLTGWLAAKGIVLANDASDTVVLEAVQRQAAESANSLVALGNEKTTLGGKVTALENELAPLRQRVATAETALTTEQTGRKAERKGRAEAVTDLAIARGKIAVAERDGQVAALSNAKDEAEFTTLAGNLVKGATRYKTTSTEAESGKVLANEQEEAAEVYQREFSKALIQTGQDPIKAHRKVMTMPGLAEKLSVKRR